MIVEGRGLIHDAAQKPDSERIAYFTGLCPLRSGALLEMAAPARRPGEARSHVHHSPLPLA